MWRQGPSSNIMGQTEVRTKTLIRALNGTSRTVPDRLIIEQQGRDQEYLRTRSGAPASRTRPRPAGPIGRLTHRSQGREIEQRITRFSAEIGQTEAELTDLDDCVGKHAPEIRERTDWRTRHADELNRLDQLDHQIDMVQRLDNIARRGLERGLERDHGIELGF